MSAASDFAKLERELDVCLAETLEVARTAAGTTRQLWGALVEAMTGKLPASPAELPPAGDAANPAEVRAVLLAVAALYERRLRFVEQGLGRDEDETLVDAVWTFRHRRLDRVVAEEVAKYIKLVAPRPSIASVFAKAANLAQATPAAAVDERRTQIHRCKTCGAPRLAERLYGDCVYCGQPFFRGREEIQ